MYYWCTLLKCSKRLLGYIWFILSLNIFYTVRPHFMLKHIFFIILFLLPHFSFSQVFIQTQGDALIGLDRKAFLGLGNTSDHSDGYAHDFTLPPSTNACQKIVGITVAINLTGYTNNNTCPHPTLYYNLFYGCGPYSGGATCLPATNMIA